ncbi:MAG: ferritin-like domain-containing protein [Gemmatimonadales bacterium]
MTDDTTRGISSPRRFEEITSRMVTTSRRTFLRVLGLGGTIALLPGAAACDSESTTEPGNEIPASGNPIVIDFSQGDVAVVQLASVLEQIEAEFYSRLVAGFATSNIAAGEQAVLTEIRDHELAHRAFLDGTLGAAAIPVTTTFRGMDFSDRTAVLAAAGTLEDLGIATYNGAAQYLTSPATLLELAKIASVEGRHSSTIRDLQQPRSNAFSSNSSDDAWRPVQSATSFQDYLVDKLAFANSPAAFLPGPNEFA